MPFDGEWFVNWGGDSKRLNHHHGIKAQNFAFDFVMAEGDKTYKGDGTKNYDYFCFGRPILAPAAGEVVEAVDGIRDNKPKDTNDYFYPGNYILIKHAQDEFSFLAHLQKHTLTVKEGDIVEAGQKIGLCGNSGNSSEPHLHYHLQDSFIFARFDKAYQRQEIAKGIKVTFDNVLVNGIAKKSYSPVRGDRVKPL